MTTPLYYDDAYVKEMDTHFIAWTQEAENRWQVILASTVFYPMGGGQPTDQGKLEAGSWTGKVYQVLHKGDKIIHYVEGEEPPAPGTAVKGTLDWTRRYLHMRLHSAAHVIDFALYLLGYSPVPLLPLKSDSGKKPTIWYQGFIEKDFKDELQTKANELIAQNKKFSFCFAEHAELEKAAIYLQPGLPTTKPLRQLTLQDVGSVADGGTQVASTAEVGPITLLPLEIKDGMTLIRYKIL